MTDSGCVIFKLFFCHDTITVVVVCTIATAKVPLGFAASLVEERNYNCYNVYFNECLLSSRQFTVILPDGTTKTISYHGHPITLTL